MVRTAAFTILAVAARTVFAITAPIIPRTPIVAVAPGAAVVATRSAIAVMCHGPRDA